MKENIQVLYNKLCKENNISRGINKGVLVFLLLFLVAFGIIVGVSLNDAKNMFDTMKYIETLEEGAEIDITKIDTGLDKEIFVLIFGIICIISVFLYIFNNKKTNQDGIYREKVIMPLLKESIEGIEYTFNTGFTEDYYNEMGFATGDTYNSKEYIKIPFKNDYIETTNIEIKNRDNDGTTTVFDGYVSEFSIPKVMEKQIKIVYTAFNLIKYDNTVPVDNSRFNEKYNILCEDAHLAIRLFTSDILFKLMELYNKHRIIVNVNIISSKIYLTSRKEVGPNEFISYEYKDIERKIKDFNFIKEMSEILYTAIESFEL